jgi:hypothetical protein
VVKSRNYQVRCVILGSLSLALFSHIAVNGMPLYKAAGGKIAVQSAFLFPCKLHGFRRACHVKFRAHNLTSNATENKVHMYPADGADADTARL